MVRFIDVYTGHTHPYINCSKETFQQALKSDLIRYQLESGSLFGELDPSVSSYGGGPFEVKLSQIAINILDIRVTDDPVNWIEFEFTFIDGELGRRARDAYRENPENLLFVPRISAFANPKIVAGSNRIAMNETNKIVFVTIDCWHSPVSHIYYTSEDGMKPSKTYIERKEDTMNVKYEQKRKLIEFQKIIKKTASLQDLLAEISIIFLRDPDDGTISPKARKALIEAMVSAVGELRDHCEAFLKTFIENPAPQIPSENPYSEAVTEDLVD